MNLESRLKKLLRENPSAFQYSGTVDAVEIPTNDNLVVFKKLNSRRKHSYPFYKPISKMINREK